MHFKRGLVLLLVAGIGVNDNTHSTPPLIENGALQEVSMQSLIEEGLYQDVDISKWSTGVAGMSKFDYVTGMEKFIQEQEEEKLDKFVNENLELMARLLNAEQGTETSYVDEAQIYAGAVVMNRLKCNYMGATTIKEVIYTKGQYKCLLDGNWEKPVSERAYKNAEKVLRGEYDVPENVVFQAEFPQGSGVWKKIGNTYFCYQ